MSSSAEPPVHFDEDIREMLRRRGSPIHQQTSCHPAGGSMRMVLPAVMHDEIKEPPTQLDSWYLPDEKVLIVDLSEENSKVSTYGQSSIAKYTSDNHEPE